MLLLLFAVVVAVVDQDSKVKVALASILRSKAVVCKTERAKSCSESVAMILLLLLLLWDEDDTSGGNRERAECASRKSLMAFFVHLVRPKVLPVPSDHEWYAVPRLYRMIPEA